MIVFKDINFFKFEEQIVWSDKIGGRGVETWNTGLRMWNVMTIFCYFGFSYMAIVAIEEYIKKPLPFVCTNFHVTGSSCHVW